MHFLPPPSAREKVDIQAQLNLLLTQLPYWNSQILINSALGRERERPSVADGQHILGRLRYRGDPLGFLLSHGSDARAGASREILHARAIAS